MNEFKILLLDSTFQDGGDSHQIGPKDADSFRNVVLICVVGLGGVFTLIFHVAIKPTDELSTKV